ncbi:MAG: glycoside hydrolase family 43 protein [Pirellulaceae bacterium]|nr:glycoside hydrolase family 43 protein [Planctomycetales bacterium]
MFIRSARGSWPNPVIVLSLFFALRYSIGVAHAEERHYVFSYFRGNGEDGLHLAHSTDGIHWTALNRDRSFLTPSVDKDRLMRDPSVVHGPDGQFHMVWTTGWHDHGIGIAHSKDLIQWSTQERIGVMDHEPKCRNCWAPEIFYDRATQKYLIFWASTIEERFPETAGSCEDNLNHRIYVTTTKDFAEYSPTRLFFDPGIPVIDSFLVQHDDQYVLITKNETRFPKPAKNLFVATSPRAEGPYQVRPQPFSPDWVEGPSVLRVGDRWLVHFDEYTRKHYSVLATNDFQTWEAPSEPLVYPQGMRHGTAFAVPGDVAEKLLNHQSPQ